MSYDGITRAEFERVSGGQWRTWLGATLAAVAVLGISLILLSKAGLLETPTDEVGASTLAATLGLVGSVFAAAMTLVGVLLKYSQDEKAAVEAHMSATRNYRLSQEEGFRNRVDVALRAVDLLGENNADSSTAQMGGALLALTSLGEHGLALALLAELWGAGKVSLDVASQVLEGAFRAGTEQSKRDAACLLIRNASKIGDGDIHIWPLPGLEWPVDLKHKTKLALVLAAIEWLKFELCKQHFCTDAVIVLHEAAQDPDKHLGDLAASALRPYIADQTRPSFLREDGSELSMAMIKKVVDQFDSSAPLSARARRLEKEVETILSGATPEREC